MAIAREPRYCHKCGERFKAIHRRMGRNFVGDTFMGYEDHTCDTTTKQYKEWESEREAYRNSPEGKKNIQDWADIMRTIKQKNDAIKAQEEAKTKPTQVEVFNEFLRQVADNKTTNIRRKFIVIKKFVEALVKKEESDDK